MNRLCLFIYYNKTHVLYVNDDLKIRELISLISEKIEIPELKNWSGLKAELEHSCTGKQWHWDSSLDFIEPPGSYNLFNFHIGGTFDSIKSKPKFRIGVLNILNTSYRDYLNRQRYFADALGRNFTLSWIQHL